MATKKRTKSHKDAADIAAKAEQVRIEMEHDAHNAYQTLQTDAVSFLNADTVAQQEGVAFGFNLNVFMADHADVLGLTLEDIAATLGTSADRLRSCRLAAGLRPFLGRLDLDDVDSYSWARIIVSGLKEQNEKGDSRNVTPDMFHAADLEHIERDFPNTCRRLGLFGEAMTRGHLPVKAARIARDADRADFDTVADMVEAKAEARADAAEASTAKTDFDRALEAIAKASKIIAGLEGEERDAAIKAAKAAFTVKAIKAAAESA
tara:strand:- start:15677 stop:16465 length:789 start_codon:yes stop_codon:yes gene_type:complete